MKNIIPFSKRLYKQENLQPTARPSGNADPITKSPGWVIFDEYENGKKIIKQNAVYLDPNNYISYFSIENNSTYFADSNNDSYYEII